MWSPLPENSVQGLAMSHIKITLFLVAAAATSGVMHAQTAESAAPSTPVLRNTCLITQDVQRLTDFYAQVLGIPAKRSGPDYAEFRTGAAVLAIFSAQAQEKYIPKSAEPASNRSTILEFEVSDVDQEHTRLKSVVKDWVKPPTTQPWGTRSFYFRDPDGNLVDFFAWVKKR